MVFEDGTFREIITREIDQIKHRRTYHPFPDMKTIRITDTIGLMVADIDKTEKGNPYRFKFKLGLNNENTCRTGRVCDRLHASIIREIMTKLDDSVNIQQTRGQLCVKIMEKLVEQHKMWIPVEYKPR